MLKRFVNLPFKVLGKAARAVQDKNDAAMKAQHGGGTEGDDWSSMDNVPEWDTPDDFDAGDTALVVADIADVLDTLCIIDVRHPRAFEGGSLPNAENLPQATLSIRLAELPPEQRIVVLCEDGRDSKEATRFLRFRGIEDAWHLAGGLAAWKHSGGTLRT